MKHARTCLLALAIVCCVGLVGCGKKGPQPDEQLLAMAKGFAEKRPQALWEALPPTYQEDVSAIIHELGEKMDAEVWTKGLALAKKACETLKAKKEMLLAHPMLAMNPKAEQVKQNWEPGVDCVLSLLNSEISDLEKIKTLDPGAFLAGTGAAFMQQLSAMSAATPEDPFNKKLANLANAKVTVLSREADQATVRFEVEGQPVQEDVMVLVEDKWIQKKIADKWQEGMAKAKEALAKLSPETMAQQKPQIMAGMTMAEQVINQLTAAKTVEEFNAVLAPIMSQIMGKVMGAMMKAQGGGMGGTPAPGGATAPQTP